MPWRLQINFKRIQGPEQGCAAGHCIASPALGKPPERAHLQNPATDHKAAKWAGHPLYAENLWEAIFFLPGKISRNA